MGLTRRGSRVALILISGLLLTLAAATSSQAAKLFMVQQPVGGLDRNSGPVLRYDVEGPASTPTFDTSFTDASFVEPSGLAFGPGGELFVINRGDQFVFPRRPSNGSITRFLHPTGTPTQNGVIESTHFDLPGFGQFRGSELFVAQQLGTNVLRFVIGPGSATFNGEISAGLCCQAPRGAVFSPSGELFVSQCCGVNDIHRYLLDGSGNAVPNGVISGNGLSNSNIMAFSPSGELFVADSDANPPRISRFTFGSGGAAIPNGTITTSTLQRPFGLAFSPWGELFVGSHDTDVVSRFVFDSNGAAIPNGSFHTPAANLDLQFAPGGTPPSLPAEVQADHPVGYWRFGETSGDVAGDSADGNDGKYVGGFLLRRPGVLADDTAVQLDGRTGHVSVPDSASLSTGDHFSLELWIKRLSSSAGTEGLFLKGYQVFLDAGKVVLRKPNVGRIAASTVAIAGSSYHHVVVTKSGSAVHIYIDGVDRTGPVVNRTIESSTRALAIGAGAAHTFRGSMDEAAVYDHALTAARVAAHFAAGR